MLSNDQEARVRFAYRVYSTGNTYGASAAVVKPALELSDMVVVSCGKGHTLDSVLFTSTATAILNDTKNN